MSLLTPKRTVMLRDAHVHDFLVYPAINGFDKHQVINELKRSQLKFKDLCEGFKYWGNLANFLTRYKAFMYQVEHELPYQITMEDDVVLTEESVRQMVELQSLADDYDLVQLGEFGELYLTSLKGATRLLKLISKHGIIKCPDQQLNDNRIMNASKIKHKIRYKLKAKTNLGDIMQTDKMSAKDIRHLRKLTGGGELSKY